MLRHRIEREACWGREDDIKVKKVVCLICMLALLSCGWIAAAAAVVNQNKDTVTITEEVQYGDVSLADGFVADLKVGYDDHLLWETVYEKDGGEMSDTEFQFSAKEMQWRHEYKSDPVAISVSFDSNLDISSPIESLSGLAKAYREIYERTQPGTEVCEAVYVKDYYEYYPLFIRLELPDNDIWMVERWLSDGSGFVNGEQELHEKFIEFFRIPVEERDSIEMVVDRDQSNGMMVQNASSDYLQLHGESVVTEDGMCYFTLNNKTSDGRVMDSSLIPGGYGLYSFRFGKPGTYSKSGVDAGSLRMVHSLNENITILYLSLNKEQTKLLLFTEEAEKYYLNVIERDTMELSQKFQLESWGEICEYDDFLVVVGESVSLFAVTENGGYEQRFSISIEQPECQALRKLSSEADMDYNGEHLIAANWLMEQEDNWMQTSDFYLLICGPEGLGYYGVYRNSLAVNQSPEDYHADCLPFGEDAITVRWK